MAHSFESAEVVFRSEQYGCLQHNLCEGNTSYDRFDIALYFSCCTAKTVFLGLNETENELYECVYVCLILVYVIKYFATNAENFCTQRNKSR